MSYTKPTISGYNTSPPSDDGSETEDNKIKWSTIKGKITDPVKVYADAINDNTETAWNDLASTATDDGTKGRNLVNYEPSSRGTEVGVVNHAYDYGIPKRYGCEGDGATDDYTNFWNCILSCIAINVPLRLGGFTYLIGSTLAFTSAQSGLTVIGEGGTIKRGFNGTLITMTSSPDNWFFSTRFDGGYGTYTGKGIVYSGTSHRPKFNGCEFKGFSDTHIEFGSDSGKYCDITGTNFFIGSGQGVINMVTTVANDTDAMFRKMVNCSLNGDISLTGALDFFFTNVSLGKVLIDANCFAITYTGGIWGNAGGAVTIYGAGIHISNVRMAADVTLAAGSDGAFFGNLFTSGGFTDNSTHGAWIIYEKDLSGSDFILGQHTLNVTGTLGGAIQAQNVISYPDADMTAEIGTTATILKFQTTLTANRTITLSTVRATNGREFRVRRAALGAFTLDVGGLKTLATGEWCSVVYNGTAWELDQFGSL